MDQDFAHQLDSHRLQRAFEAKAAEFDDHAWLYREVGNRLLEHLEPMVIEPRRVLDLGSATGEISRALTRRFKPARVYSLDFARQMLFQARAKSTRWFRRHHLVCANAERLCLADNCLQLVCSNLLLPWAQNPREVLSETYRVLDSGGLLVLSSFGPQTLLELREAFKQVDNNVHVNAFMDMHNLGDAMTVAGYHDVVVDAERVKVSYKTFKALLQDVQALGAGNANRGRRSGLMGRGSMAALEQSYAADHQGDQYIISFELVFAHGWKPAPSRGPVEVGWRESGILKR